MCHVMMRYGVKIYPTTTNYHIITRSIYFYSKSSFMLYFSTFVFHNNVIKSCLKNKLYTLQRNKKPVSFPSVAEISFCNIKPQNT